MTTKQPDLSQEQAIREAVAYGKLLATREILEALAKGSPRDNPWTWHPLDDVTGYHENGQYELVGYQKGYWEAIRIVKAMRLGVEKP